MKTIIADDHPLVRESLVGVVEELLPGGTVLEASTGPEVLSLLEKEPDIQLLLLDLMMPGVHGFELLEAVCSRFPELIVMVFSASEKAEDMRKCLDIGASGFLSKCSAPGVIGSAIRLVVDGGIYVPRELLDAPGGRPSPSPSRRDSVLSNVTPRQREVVRLLAHGRSNKEIARELGLSEHTVKIHVASLLRALGVTNRTQAAIAAREQGLLEE